MSEHDPNAALLGALLAPRELRALLEQRGLEAHIELRDAKGQPLAPERQAELLQELQSARLKFEHLQRLASLGALAAGMAHEARNLLTGSLGFSQLIAAKPHDLEAVREMARTVEHETRRCVALLASFLCLSRSDSEPERALSVSEIIAPAERLVSQPLHHRGCTLAVALADPLPSVFGRASELQRALINLILNAADATRADGHIWLTARAAAAGCVEISVTDDGPGVPSELAERIFEPFFSTKPAHEGTGLGLSLSRSIAEAHRGSLTLHRSLGRGATFTLKLPAGGAP